MSPRNRQVPRIVGLLAVLVLGPAGVVLGLSAAYYAARQVLGGWIPGDWWSGSMADWAVGFGQKGSASNYLGFMVSGVPAYLCLSGVRWGISVVRR